MTPKLVCPHCGENLTAEAALREGLWVEALRSLAKFGRAAMLTLEYLELFRLPKRGMSAERRVRLIQELLPLWETGKYQWQGCTYRAERDQIIEAFQDVLGSRTLKPPLKNHNYLKSVLHPLAQRIEGRRERETEEARRSGVRNDHPSEPRPDPRGEPSPKPGPQPPRPAPRPERPDEDAPPEVVALCQAGKLVEATNLWTKIRAQEDSKLRPLPKVDGFATFGED